MGVEESAAAEWVALQIKLNFDPLVDFHAMVVADALYSTSLIKKKILW
eukprot:SAG11_NODE_469_length_9207_cov_5.391744_4_plen_48_part_00